VTGETAEIGNHVKIYQGVGLVARSLSRRPEIARTKRHPTVEDHVTIYANATIVGGERSSAQAAPIGANVS